MHANSFTKKPNSQTKLAMTPKELSQKLGVSADALRKCYDRMNLGRFGADEQIPEETMSKLRTFYMTHRTGSVKSAALALFAGEGEDVSLNPDTRQSPPKKPTPKKGQTQPHPDKEPTQQSGRLKTIAAGVCVGALLTFSFFSMADVFSRFSGGIAAYSLSFVFSIGVLYFTLTGEKKNSVLLAVLMGLVHGAYFGIFGEIWAQDPGTIVSAFVATVVTPALDVKFAETFAGSIGR